MLQYYQLVPFNLIVDKHWRPTIQEQINSRKFKHKLVLAKLDLPCEEGVDLL